MRHSQSDISQMAAAIQGSAVVARQWLDEGFSPGDAAAYVQAGCFDVGRTVELQRAGISPSRIARLGLGWDYCAGRVGLAELREGGHGTEPAELPWEVTTSRETAARARALTLL